jgi:hypothetical protein
MTNLQEILKSELEKLISQSKTALGEVKRVALSQAWNILQITVASVVQKIELTSPELVGKDKKSVALDLLSQFYDKVFTIVDIPFVPSFLEPIIRDSVKKILMILVGASIDAIVTTFRQTGIFSTK